MNTRKHFLAVAFTLAAGYALAAPPAVVTVEILAMPHPPVKMALAPLRDWLAAQGTKLKVVETDVESPQGEKRLVAVGLGGHIPIVILISVLTVFENVEYPLEEYDDHQKPLRPA